MGHGGHPQGEAVRWVCDVGFVCQVYVMPQGVIIKKYTEISYALDSSLNPFVLTGIDTPFLRIALYESLPVLSSFER